MLAVAVAASFLAVPGARGTIDVIVHGATTINMAFVGIGSPGNAGDAAHSGYGDVAYSYSIGTYEVTADQWAAVRAAAPGVGNAGAWSGSEPTGGTTWYEAAKFCNWLTTGNINQGVYNTTTWAVNRSYRNNQLRAYFIPTEDEWYKAAYYDPTNGGNYYDYPTSSDTAPTGVYGGTSPSTAVYDSLGAVDPLAPANVDNSGGLSPFLTMGQGGNVWEWTETASGVLRGGSYAVVGGSWLSAAHREIANPSGDNNYQVGFRVGTFGVVPEPGSLGLLLLGLVGLVARRGRSAC